MSRTSQPSLDLRRGWLSLFLSILFVGFGGVLLWASPFGQSVEKQFGLELAFWLRGDRPAPSDVVYIAVDQESADKICPTLRNQESVEEPEPCSVGELPRWARPVFAKLVDRLSDAGASLIVFDINFMTPGGKDDQVLADAIEHAGNVVLLSGINQRDPELVPGVIGWKDKLLKSAPLFSNNAIATGTMALPLDARQDRYFTFSKVAGRFIPTLPTVALYLHTQRMNSVALSRCEPLQRVTEETRATQALEKLRSTVRHESMNGISLKESAACADFLQSAIGQVVSTSPGRYFNLYGRPGTLTGPTLYELTENDTNSDLTKLRGKVVFVGLDDRSNLNAGDAFRTAVEPRAFSGVELATTAFANLLHGHDLRAAPPITAAALLLVLTCLMGLLFLLPVRIALRATIACAGIFLFFAWYRFAQAHEIFPLVIPLFVQTPLMIALGWRWRLGELKRIADTLKRFVPRWLKTRIRKRTRISTNAEHLFGVCMHTDVAGYTSLSERLASEPLRLKALEREYWSLIDTEITREHGERLEISGDGMLCVWAAGSCSADMAMRACRAAMAIHRVVDDFNLRHPDTPLNTRIGLHAGKIALGLIGGSQRYTLAVGGDIANTAARLENDLNKLLGTRLLVSEAIASMLEGIPMRRVGTFVPRGKNTAVRVHEIIESSNSDLDLSGFGAALSAFDANDWEEAYRGFAAIQQRYPADGPTRFYTDLSSACRDETLSLPIGLVRRRIDLNDDALLSAISSNSNTLQ